MLVKTNRRWLEPMDSLRRLNHVLDEAFTCLAAPCRSSGRSRPLGYRRWTSSRTRSP